MNCPNCQIDSSKVIDKRNWEGSGLSGTKRRRECLGCDHRWTTLELSITFQGRAVILPGMGGNTYGPRASDGNGNGHKSAPKPQPAITAKERDLKKRLAMALHRARCKSVVIEDEDLE